VSINREEEVREKLERAKDEVIGAIAETMDLYGVTSSAGTLYATMYFNDTMNLDEMREELNMSKPSMSTGVRKLQDNGMVKRVFQRGTRKHLYRAEKDFFESFMAFYCKMWEREARQNLEAISVAEKELEEIVEMTDISEALKEEASSHLDLLAESKIYYKWLKRLSESVKSEDIFEFLPKEENDD